LTTLILAGATDLQTGKKFGRIAETHVEHQGKTDPYASGRFSVPTLLMGLLYALATSAK
jgi:hypothetical protein